MAVDRDFPGIILLLLVIIFLVIVASFVFTDVKDDIRHLSQRIDGIEVQGDDGKR